MKKQMITLALALGLVGFIASAALAQEAVKVGNKICPISGEEIGEDGMTGQEVTVEYKGKVYNLCCAMCKKDFLKDPETAIKKLEAAQASEVAEVPEADIE
jgi:YHS domain-containing protein